MAFRMSTLKTLETPSYINRTVESSTTPASKLSVSQGQIFDVMSENEQVPTVCKECHLSIPKGARLCTHCGSHQDFRRWFPASTGTLAILTALISVIGVSAPAIKQLIKAPSSSANVVAPSVDGTTLRFLAINEGDAPATFLRAFVRSEFLAAATRINLRDDADAIIPPGSKLLVFDIVPLLTKEESEAASLEAMAGVLDKTDEPSANIEIEIAQYNGDISINLFRLGSAELFYMLQANSKRCASIKEPTSVNGCAGYQIPAETQKLLHDQLKIDPPASRPTGP